MTMNLLRTELYVNDKRLRFVDGFREFYSHFFVKLNEGMDCGTNCLCCC